MNKKAAKYYVFMVIAVLGVYVSCATTSALWYDESIEYFFSKFVVGSVPGGRATNSMYERICSTYQPPLYNWLMYIWLMFFDSEFGFRMAGIATTILGGLGFFLGLNKLTNEKYAAIGTLVYHLTTSVAYYALECAEYNLMLSCICWALYFFISYLVDRKIRQLVGFFVFAILSVYSQYGAAFIIVALYFVLVWDFLSKKNENVCLLIGLTAVAAAFGTLLIVFFLVPQIIRQGTTAISHVPYFAYGNVFKDILVSLNNHIRSVFCAYCKKPSAVFIVVMVTGIATVFALLLTKDKILEMLVAVTVISWGIYYLVVACSFYGYNSWNASSIGTSNIGGRYGLFFVPLWSIVLLYGLYMGLIMTSGKWKPICKYVGIILALTFGISSCFGIYNFPPKDDVREVTNAWYQIKAYKERTLVHQWDDANFQYYLTHDNRYCEQYQSNIVAADYWIRNADAETMETELKKLGFLDNASFYYITPIEAYQESYGAFVSVMEKYGYSVDKTYSGKSALIKVTKWDPGR